MIAHAHNGDVPANGGTYGGGESEYAVEVRAMKRVSVVDLSDDMRRRAMEECGGDYIAFLKDGLKPRPKCYACERSGVDRTAATAFTKLVTEAGKARDIVSEMQRALGGARVEEATTALEAQRSAAQLAENPRQLAVRLWAHVKAYCAENGVSVEELDAQASGAEVLP